MDNFENQNIYNNQPVDDKPPVEPQAYSNNQQSEVNSGNQYNNQYSQPQYGQYNNYNNGMPNNQYNPNQYVSTTEPVEESGRGLAIASLVLGIVSFFCCGSICSIVGLVLGIVSRSKQKENNGMATAGIVLSVIALALWAVYVVLALVFGALDNPSNFNSYIY